MPKSLSLLRFAPHCILGLGNRLSRLLAVDKAFEELQEPTSTVHDAGGLQESWTKEEVCAGHRRIFKGVAQFLAIARTLFADAGGLEVEPNDGPL